MFIFQTDIIQVEPISLSRNTCLLKKVIQFKVFPSLLDLTTCISTLFYIALYKKLQRISSIANTNFTAENRRVLYQMEVFFVQHVMLPIDFPILTSYFIPHFRLL